MSDDLLERLGRGCNCGRCKLDLCCCAAMEEAKDRIEAQAAEIERLKGAWEDEARRYAGNAEYWQTETERLREAGNDLGFYAGHEDACDCVKGWAKGPCNCGYTEAWQAWRAALGETE